MLPSTATRALSIPPAGPGARWSAHYVPLCRDACATTCGRRMRPARHHAAGIRRQLQWLRYSSLRSRSAAATYSPSCSLARAIDLQLDYVSGLSSSSA